jgi:hypothetical protein
MPGVIRHPAAALAQRQNRMAGQIRHDGKHHFFWPPKSTWGGVEIWASFCTVKLGLGS